MTLVSRFARLAWPACVFVSWLMPACGVAAQDSTGVHVVWQSVQSDRDGLFWFHDIAVLDDGTFAHAIFQAKSIDDRPAHPVQLISQIDDAVRQDRAGTNLVNMAASQRPLDRPPGPIQWAFAPWPVEARLTTWLQSSDDLTASQATSAQSMNSAETGWSVTWTGRDISTVMFGTVLRVDFRDYEMVQELRLPRTMAVSYGTQGTPQEFRRVSADTAAKSDIDKVFDLKRWKMYTFDSGSGEVFALDGTRLYNLYEQERIVAGDVTPWWRSRISTVAIVAGLTIAAGAYLWRKNKLKA